MALSSSTPCSPTSLKAVQRSFLQRDGLVFANILTEGEVEQVFDKHGVCFAQDQDANEVVYTPAATSWTFLSQMLFQGVQRSCCAAVMRLALFMAVHGRHISADTGAYCRARIKLSHTAMQELTLTVADGCERALPDEWLWRGRHLFLVDGTTFTMPDTPENQAEWPQQSQQKEGLGFPIARMVTALSLATGMLAGMDFGPYQGKETGETALFRELLDGFEAGDVLVADSYYCSYFMIALAQQRGLDVVYRQHQRRHMDFQQGRRLGKGDHVATWRRPQRPDWMDEETYAAMPEELRVREVQVHVTQPGFRTDKFVAVTTLTDVDTYSAEDVGEIYHRRWLAELDIRSIKTTMGFDVLRCKSPDMIRTELWGGLLAYNLIRKTMLEAAAKSGASPRELSFAAAMQAISAGWQVLGMGVLSDEAQASAVSALLDCIALYRVGNRPGRTEPRAVKRRPKGHKLLTKPRAEARLDRVLVDGRKKHK